MTTHSSILAWRIPWTEELGRLQFMGSQRFEHDCVTNHHHHHHYLMRAYEMSIINDPWLLERPRLFALQALSFSGHSDIAKKKKKKKTHDRDAKHQNLGQDFSPGSC